MSSIQFQIRAAVRPALQAATGLEPLNSPRQNLATKQLPALILFSHGDKPLDANEDHSRQHPRVYTLRVEIRVQDRPEDDATDDLAVLVRTTILQGGTFGVPAVREVFWLDQQWAGAEGDVPLVGTALDFNFVYLWSPE